MDKREKRKKDIRKRNSIDVVEMNNYVRENPHELLRQGRKYITNGDNNEYFYFVESRYLGSPTNQAVIDNYVNYIVGDGLEAVSGITQDELDEILTEKDLRALVTQFKMQGNAPLQVVYAKSGERVARLYAEPAKRIAIQAQDDLTQEIKGYWYCFDWTDRYKFKPYKIPAFGHGQGNKSEIYYIQQRSPQPLFSLPDYQSCLQYCQVEEELSNYYISHISNNFSAGKIINIYQGEPLDEEAEEEAERTIKRKLTGSSAAGKTIIAFNHNTEEETKVENIEIEDAYQQFETLSKEARQKIMLSHKVTNPALFGFTTPTGFNANGDELRISLQMLYRAQIEPMRRELLKALEEVLSVNAENVELKFKDFNPLAGTNENPSDQPGSFGDGNGNADEGNGNDNADKGNANE